MSANTIITSVVTGGTNSHATVAEEANVIATDFVTQGVVGAITANTGSGGTGSFCVNQNTGSNLAINILAGQAYITATPSSQDSQVLRARASSDYTAYTISSNSSGSTKYDWIYLSVSATNANNPASDASNVTSISTSRSSSNATDNGTPPTYGLLLAIVTVTNGATAITNSNITDKRFNTSIGAQNGSLIVTQASTGTDATIQAAGIDANVNVNIVTKGTGIVKFNGVGAWQSWTPTLTNLSGGTINYAKYIQIGKTVFFRFKYTLAGAGVTGSVGISLPVTVSSGYTEPTDTFTTTGQLNDADNVRWPPFGVWGSSTTMTILALVSGSLTVISSTVPFTWASGDEIMIQGFYEAA